MLHKMEQKIIIVVSIDAVKFDNRVIIIIFVYTIQLNDENAINQTNNVSFQYNCQLKHHNYYKKKQKL